MSDRRGLVLIVAFSFALGVAVHALLGGFTDEAPLDIDTGAEAADSAEVRPSRPVSSEQSELPDSVEAAPSALPAPAPTGRVTLEGRCWIVAGDKSRTPAADARVILRSLPAPGEDDAGFEREVRADTEGRFRFDKLPSGTRVRVLMERDDLYCHRDRSEQGGDVHLVRVLWPADHARDSVRSLELVDEQHEIELSAARGYVVRGRVVDEAGGGIPDALVSVHSGSDHQILAVRTGPDGYYRLGCLHSLRTVRFKASRVGYRSQDFREDLRDAAAGGYEAERDIVLTRAGAIRVIAYSYDGGTVEGMRVGIAPEGDRIYDTRPVKTNEAVTFDGLVQGQTYRVFLLEKGFRDLPLSVSEKLTPREEVLEVELKQPPRGRVNVKVDLNQFEHLVGGEVLLFHRSTSIEVAGVSWSGSRKTNEYAKVALDDGGNAHFDVPAIGGWRVLAIPAGITSSLLATGVYPRRKTFDDGTGPIILGGTKVTMPPHGVMDFYLDEPFVAGQASFSAKTKRLVSLRPRPISGVATKPLTRATHAGRRPRKTAFLWPGVYETLVPSLREGSPPIRRALRIESGKVEKVDLDKDR